MGFDLAAGAVVTAAGAGVLAEAGDPEGAEPLAASAGTIEVAGTSSSLPAGKAAAETANIASATAIIATIRIQLKPRCTIFLHSSASIFISTLSARVFRSARSADRASFDVAGRALMLVMRLLALGEQKPFENVMIDKIPRQQLVVSVMPGDEKIGIGQIGISCFHLAMNLHQLVPDWTGAIESGGFESFEDF